MAAASGAGHPHPVIEYFEAEGYRFNFFQAVSLLERAFPDSPSPGESFELEKERLRFRPAATFGHSPNSIVRIQERPRVHREHENAPDYGQAQDQGRVIEVVLSFLGLYGADSPLPQYLSYPIAEGAPGAEALQDFLDIFNHRLYSLLYQAWKKHRHYLSFRPEANDLLSQYALCLGGLGAPALQQALKLPPTRLMAYAGLLSTRFHCADGLAAVISDYLDGVEVKVRQFVPQWLPIPERRQLGRDSRLGRNIVIGSKVLDYASKITLVVGPIDNDKFWQFQPGTPDWNSLHALFQLYTRDCLAFDLEFLLKTDNLPPYRLGAPYARLGWNIFLGQPQAPVVKITVHPEQKNLTAK